MAELSKLGRYRLERVLGKGAMGVVYEGFDPRLNRRVAVKTILKSHLDDHTAQDYSKRFEREAQAVARLNHPNIVQVHDFGEEGDVAYLVMEFIKGRELKSYFGARERFPLDEAVRILCELCDALDFAHEAGVVHRDVKPANVMLDARMRVKLTDFGVARLQDANRSQATQQGTMVGTPAYMSPEQISGAAVDGRSDIFSAGVVLYQFLTGEMPFGGGGAWTIAKKIMQDQPPRPSSIDATIPPYFDRVVAKALAKNPAQRYQSAQQFAAALRHALEGKAEDDGTIVQPDIEPPISTTEAEVEFWRSISEGNDAEDFKLYLQQYPDGIYAALAQRKIEKLQPPPRDRVSQEEEWRRIEQLARAQDAADFVPPADQRRSARLLIPVLGVLVIVAGIGAYVALNRPAPQETVAVTQSETPAAPVATPPTSAKPLEPKPTPDEKPVVKSEPVPKSPASKPATETATPPAGGKPAAKSEPALAPPPVAAPEAPAPKPVAEAPAHPSLKFFLHGTDLSTSEAKELVEATAAFLKSPARGGREALTKLAETGNDFAALALSIRPLGVSRSEASVLADRLVKKNVLARLQRLATSNDNLATYWLVRATFEQTASLARLQPTRWNEHRMEVLAKLVSSADRGYVPAQVQAAVYSTWWLDDDETLAKNGEIELGWLKTKWIGNPRKTLPTVTRAAEAGYVSAQALLGDIYGSGRQENGKIVVAQDEKRALAWYQKALEQGSPEDYPPPSASLAHALLRAKDDRAREQGFRLMSEASEMGFASAKIYLAYLHANGRRVPRNEALARTHLTQAARLESRIRNWGRIGGVSPPWSHRIHDDFGIRVAPEFPASIELGQGSKLYPAGAGRIMVIKDVILEGNSVFPPAELKRLLSLTLSPGSYEPAELQERLNKLRAFYRERGHFLAQVHVPAAMSDGVFRAVVWEGRVEKIVINQKKEEQCLPPGVLESYFAQAVPANSPVTEHSLEAAVIPLYDGLPCTITTGLAPASRPGFTNLIVDLAIDKNATWQ
jgi:eukaryotic-like serine/threonine-protein kinase